MLPLIPLFTGTMQGRAIQMVDARLLHQFLEVGRRFASWIVRRIEEYGFVAGEDFLSFSPIREKPQGGRPRVEYYLTLGMAKELAMVERTPKGREARRYFIECERLFLEWAASALRIAKPRSQEQNRMMWACLGDIAARVTWDFQHLTAPEWKDVFTAALRREKMVPGINGGLVLFGERTRTMGAEEVADLIELMTAFAAEQGILRWSWEAENSTW